MAKKKFLRENDEQIWPITRMDCIYTMDGTQLLPDALDEEFEEIDNAIDEINEELGSVLLKTEQELTDEEKDQVRENLGYIGKAATVGEKVTVDDKEYTVENNAEIFGDYDTNKAIGAWSIAEGSENIAVGKASHAEGAMNKAIGTGTHVEGVQCTATGYWSHAEGERTIVSSYASHAEGSYTNLPDGSVSYGTASGYASHVEGGGCHATGSCSHAQGLGTRANGYYSNATGAFTVASGQAQTTEGRCNIEDTANKYIHIAGNGTWDNGQTAPTRSNAYTLDWNGNGWFAGNISIGADNKQLATEEFVNDAIDNIPEGFSGDYNDLENKPEIPTVTNDLTDELKANYDTAYERSVSGMTKMYCIDGSSGSLLASHAPSTDRDSAVFYSTKAYITSSGSIETSGNINAKAFYEDGTALENKYVTDESLSAVAKSGSYNDLTNKPTASDIGAATEEYVNEKIAEIRDEMIILEEDDLSMEGLIDNTFPSLTTTDKTLIGAINELNNKLEKAPSGGDAPSEGIETEIDKVVIDNMLMDVLGITIGDGE